MKKNYFGNLKHHIKTLSFVYDMTYWLERDELCSFRLIIKQREGGCDMDCFRSDLPPDHQMLRVNWIKSKLLRGHKRSLMVCLSIISIDRQANLGLIDRLIKGIEQINQKDEWCGSYCSPTNLRSGLHTLSKFISFVCRAVFICILRRQCMRHVLLCCHLVIYSPI